MKKTPCSVAVADNNSIVRRRVKYFLAQNDFSICLEAENGKELLAHLAIQEVLPKTRFCVEYTISPVKCSQNDSTSENVTVYSGCWI